MKSNHIKVPIIVDILPVTGEPHVARAESQADMLIEVQDELSSEIHPQTEFGERAGNIIA